MDGRRTRRRMDGRRTRRRMDGRSRDLPSDGVRRVWRPRPRRVLIKRSFGAARAVKAQTLRGPVLVALRSAHPHAPDRPSLQPPAPATRQPPAPASCASLLRLAASPPLAALCGAANAPRAHWPAHRGQPIRGRAAMRHAPMGRHRGHAHRARGHMALIGGKRISHAAANQWRHVAARRLKGGARGGQGGTPRRDSKRHIAQR